MRLDPGELSEMGFGYIGTSYAPFVAPELNLADRQAILILNTYKDKVNSGSPVFSAADRSSWVVRDQVSENTSIHKNIVLAFLFALEKKVKSKSIPYSELDPRSESPISSPGAAVRSFKRSVSSPGGLVNVATDQAKKILMPVAGVAALVLLGYLVVSGQMRGSSRR